MMNNLISMMLWLIACILVFKHVVSEERNLSSVGSAEQELNYTFDEGAGSLENKTTLIGEFHPRQSNLSKEEYRWLIIPTGAKNGSKLFVSLFFSHLFLHEADEVTVFKTLDDSLNNSNSLIEPLRAQNGSITIVSDLPSLVVKLEGKDHVYQRKFEGYYTSQACAFTLPPDSHIIHSPIYIGNKENSIDCKYTYNRDPHHRIIPVFLFDIFNFTKSKVNLEGSTLNGLYNNEHVVEFFPQKDHSALSIDVEYDVKSKEYFRLNMHMVDSACSDYIELNNPNTYPITSPEYQLDNGTFGDECRMIFKHSVPTNVLGVTFDQLSLTNALDVISINDGASEISTPIMQVTTSTSEHTLGQLIRSSGPYLWISFKPIHYTSKMVANITVHGQGGYFKNEGEISMKNTVGNDTVFLLEVKENNVVMLNITSSTFSYPATLSIYDGFDKKKLLTTIHNPVSYPILSESHRLMIIATSFSAGSFSATFKGIVPGCSHMNTPYNENYILSGNCNAICQWIIPPQDLPTSSLLLNIQYVSLEKNDTINIYHLDATKTLVGTIKTPITHVPQMTFSSATGALVEINRKQCIAEDKIALIGHSSFVPTCGGEIYANQTKNFTVVSPLYPDTYPVLANCKWNLIATPKDSLIHLTFTQFDLVPHHCVKIFNSKNNSVEFSGSELPDDIFLSGNSQIYFDSSNCSTSKAALQLASSSGFALNGTVADCGAVLENQSKGEFTIDVSSTNKSLCVWKINVQSSESSVNIISYTITKTSDKGNSELKVFDGPSIRDSEIANMSTTAMWSKRNTLIFVYKRLDVTKASSTFVIKYESLGCNSSMLCDNKICLHPDWRCNGINECGDFTDEKNCESIPVNPNPEPPGYSSVAFWVTIFCMLAVGVLLGFGVPVVYQKYANGQYHRFSDISVIE